MSLCVLLPILTCYLHTRTPNHHPSATRYPLSGSVKTLHLFEARYLSLLDTVLAQPNANKVFGHVIVEQQGDAFGDQAAAFPGAYKGEGFVFVMATLVRVSELGV